MIYHGFCRAQVCWTPSPVRRTVKTARAFACTRWPRSYATRCWRTSSVPARRCDAAWNLLRYGPTARRLPSTRWSKPPRPRGPAPGRKRWVKCLFSTVGSHDGYNVTRAVLGFAWNVFVNKCCISYQASWLSRNWIFTRRYYYVCMFYDLRYVVDMFRRDTKQKIVSFKFK